MGKMQELYEKVAGNNSLQAKFTEIMKGAEEAGEAVTGEKLVVFAKEAGYDISIDEMKAFFKELSEKSGGELSNMELDMVAGGKSDLGIMNVVFSALTFGMSCAAISLAALDKSNNCGKVFE